MIYNRREANCNRQLSMEFVRKSVSGARTALFLLLGINLFNYIDRQILAALEPDIRATFFRTWRRECHVEDRSAR